MADARILEPEDQGRFLGGHLSYFVFFFIFSVAMLSYFMQVISDIYS